MLLHTLRKLLTNDDKTNKTAATANTAANVIICDWVVTAFASQLSRGSKFQCSYPDQPTLMTKTQQISIHKIKHQRSYNIISFIF